MNVVIDASALVQVILDPQAETLAAFLIDARMHAPAHVRVEAVSVLRRERNAGLLSAAQTTAAFAAVMTAPLRLWPFEFVANRAWELGENTTTYNAAYLALAEHLGAPLITHDAKLAGVPGTKCAVDVL